MATKSIMKNVTIKDRKSALALANALDSANRRKSVDVSFSRSVREASREDIAKIFKDQK